MNKPKNAISPTRSENYPEWYQQVIRAADLAENSVVRGCMVIKPWGYGIWERIQSILDRKFKETGHENAYFPLFIPLEFLEREASHVEGFAKECAVVTHHRLKDDGKGGLIPDGKLTQPLVVRPTSETIIGESYSKWVQSYRDLPLLINQWANVVRWEMRTRLFLRTSEFLWQEGHTVHASQEEAMEETLKMHEVYRDFATNSLAIPVFSGEKTANERFPGAERSFSIEGIMQDGKALQAGTSHFLGQNFAKASNIQFIGRDETRQYAWTTSWGVSTRLIGAVIMTHSDDDGLVLPPAVASQQIVIIPFARKPEEQEKVKQACESLAASLRKVTWRGEALRIKIDNSDGTSGEKNWKHIKRGVPLRIEIGPRELESQKIVLAQRNKAHKDKETLSSEELIQGLEKRLEDLQNDLLSKARGRQKALEIKAKSFSDLEKVFTHADEDATLGYALCHIDDTAEVHNALKKINISARCVVNPKKLGPCLISGKQVPEILVARAY